MEQEKWAVKGTDLHKVIVVHEGPHDDGTRYVDGRHEHTICICSNDEGKAKERANLIAAAPEMLKLLEEYAGDGIFNGAEWYKRVQEIIKKATI